MYDENYILNLKRSILFGWIFFSIFVLIGSFLGGYYVFLGYLLLTVRYLALPIYIPYKFKLDPSGIFSYFQSLIHRHSFYGWTKFAINSLIVISGFVALSLSGFIAATILLCYESFHYYQIQKTKNYTNQ